MAVVAKSLQPGTTLTDALASVFTAGAGISVVTGGVLSNPTTVAVSFTVQIQRSGGTALDLIPKRSLQPNTTDLLPELSGLVMESGDTLLAEGAGIVCVLNGYALS